MVLMHYFNKIENVISLFFSVIKQNTIVFILFLVVVNLIVKSYNLYENSLHIDEVYRITWGQCTYTDILKMSKQELNPPGYLFVLHTWIKLNGNYTNEVHSRYLSLIFSVLTTIVIFLFAKSYFNYTTGVIASLIFSFNSIQVVYAHNISAYTMITFLFVLSLYVTHLFFVHFQYKQRKWLLFIFLILIDTTLLYTHYTIVFGLFAQFIMAFFEYFKNKKAFFKYIITQVITIFLFLPWIPYMLANAKAGSWMEKANWQNIKNLYIHFIGSEFIFLLFLLLLIFTVLYNIWKRKVETHKILIPLLIAILPVIGLSAVCLLYQPFWVERYMLYLIPGLILLFAYPISILNNHLVKSIIVGIFLFFCIKNTDFNPIVDAQLRQVMPAIAEEVKEPGTLLVICVDYMKYTFAYYFNQYNAFIGQQEHIIKDPINMNAVFIAAPSDIEKINDMLFWNKIVYVQLHSQYVDPHHKVSTWLKNNFEVEKIIVAKAVGFGVYRSYNTLWTDDYHTTLFTSFEDSKKYQHITSKNKKNGNFSAFSNHKTVKFSEGIQGKIGKLYGKKGKIKVSAWLYLEKDTQGNLVLSLFDRTGEQYLWQSVPIDYTKYEQWQYVSMEVPIPETKSENDILKSYFNAFSGGTAYIDDLEIQAIFEP